MQELIEILILTGKTFFGFILFIIALSISTLMFAIFWFTVKYRLEMRYKLALEDYRINRSNKRRAKDNHKDVEDDD